MLGIWAGLSVITLRKLTLHIALLIVTECSNGRCNHEPRSIHSVMDSACNRNVRLCSYRAGNGWGSGAGNMTSREHAARHLLALPSWKQEQLESERHDTRFDAAHDFRMRWRARQEANHAIELQEQQQ